LIIILISTIYNKSISNYCSTCIKFRWWFN